MGGSRISAEAPVLGLLFGIRTATNLIVQDSTDIFYEIRGKDVVINEIELGKKIRLWTSIHESNSLLGWYTFGASVELFHDIVHESVRYLWHIFRTPSTS